MQTFKTFKEIITEKSPGQAGIDAAREDDRMARRGITFEPGSKKGTFKVLVKGKVKKDNLSSKEAREFGVGLLR